MRNVYISSHTVWLAGIIFFYFSKIITVTGNHKRLNSTWNLSINYTGGCTPIIFSVGKICQAISFSVGHIFVPPPPIFSSRTTMNENIVITCFEIFELVWITEHAGNVFYRKHCINFMKVMFSFEYSHVLLYNRIIIRYMKKFSILIG